MFSKQLILKAVEFLPQASHNALEDEIIKLDLEGRTIKYNGSIHDKKRAIQTYLLSNPLAVDNHGDSIILRMMNSVVKKMLINVERGLDEFNEETFEFKSDKNFYRYLRLDGYDIDFENACIIEDLANYTQIAEKDDEIMKMMKKYNFNTSIGHYEQAKGSYIGGNYAALNGQLRTFVEGIFQDMASYIKFCEPSNSNIQSINDIDAQNAMIVFAKCFKPILEINLNEWSGDGTTNSYFSAFWKRLHPEGSHPGLPNFSEAIYRFQLVVLNIELVIQRFQKNYPLRNC